MYSTTTISIRRRRKIQGNLITIIDQGLGGHLSVKFFFWEDRLIFSCDQFREAELLVKRNPPSARVLGGTPTASTKTKGTVILLIFVQGEAQASVLTSELCGRQLRAYDPIGQKPATCRIAQCLPLSVVRSLAPHVIPTVMMLHALPLPIYRRCSNPVSCSGSIPKEASKSSTG